MKKLTAILMATLLLFSLSACKTPTEKLNNYITSNGEKDGANYVLDCPDIAETFKDSDFTIAAMDKQDGTEKAEFQLIQGDDGITVKLVDYWATSNGIVMERNVTINPNGTYRFENSLIYESVDFGLYIEGNLPLDTYSKSAEPEIVNYKLAPGASLTDEVTSTLKEYIDLTLDCYSLALAQDALGLTLADVGFNAYPGK